MENNLKRFLDDQHVRYVPVQHPQAFTAQEVAASAHIPGKEMAKTVMVKLDDELAMAVLPAPDHVSFNRLKEATGAGEARLASESEFQDRFPGCELGAMHPFGNLWGLPVFVDQRLREDELIAFNAGTHTEVVQLAYSDFERLVHPTVVNLSTHN
jgi:Ala-tRNA(Pro) deacylase